MTFLEQMRLWARRIEALEPFTSYERAAALTDEQYECLWALTQV